jgi:integrase
MEIAVDRKRRKEKKQTDSFGASLEADGITIQDAIKEFLTNRKARGFAANTEKSYKRALGLFEQYMSARGVSVLRNVRAAMTGAHIDEMASRYSVRTRNAQYKILQVFLSFAEEREYVVAAPLLKSSRPAVPKGGAYRPLTHAEQATILRACDTPMKRAFFLLGVCTGLRVSDLARLAWRNVDFTKRSISIVPQKTSESRPDVLVIPALPNLLFDVLRTLPRSTDVNALLLGCNNSQSLECCARRLSEKSGVEFSCHDMRCTFGVERLSNGAGIWEVSQLLGHSSVTTTERYYIKWIPRLHDRLERAMKMADFSHLESKAS